MPSDEFYENEFEALVPHPPVAAHNVPSPPARPPEGLDEDVMTPETSPLHEYGRLDLDNAVFEPDDFFMAAAQNKGIVDVEREFAPKVLSDFFHGLAKTSADLASQIAAKRLASYEFSRSRKMALVLRERERLIRIELSSRQDQHTHHTPPSQHSRSSSRGNKYLEKGVASLRPPALAVPASQTDSLELWREKLRFTQTQEAKNTRAKFFREKRTHDEGARQEAAYNEMRIRHLVTSVQQRELERLNEGVAVERHKRYEHARRVRQAMRAEWQAASQAKSNTLEGKQTNVEAHLQHLVSARRSETTHRAALREQRIKNAELVRRYTDEQRDRALEEKSDKRNEVGKRKMDLEAGRMLALRHKRELQEAYSKQVVATSAKMSELKASEIVEKHQRKECRSDVLRHDGSQDSTWRGEALAASNQMRRDKVQHYKTMLTAQAEEGQRARAEHKEQTLTTAEATRGRRTSLRQETLRLSQERRNETRQRVYNEQEQLRRQLEGQLQEKYQQKEQRLAELACLKRGLAAAANCSSAVTTLRADEVPVV